LNSVAPYDWRKFFSQRVSNVRPEAPVEGLELAGWRLVLGDEPSEYHALAEEDGYKYLFRSGLTINNEGEIDDVFPGSPADDAGLVPGSRVIAVDHFRFTPHRLLQSSGTTELIIEHEDLFWNTQLEIPEGGDFPTLERIEDRPDLLPDILEPRRSSAGTR